MTHEEALQESGRSIEQERLRAGETAAAAARDREEIAQLRQQLQALQKQLPEWETRAHAVAEEHGGLSKDAAAEYVANLRTQKRYRRDVY